MARYAALCQEADIVPIVEPEILMDGDHGDRAPARRRPRGRSTPCSRSWPQHRVDLPGSLLKVNMVVPGKGSPRPGSDARRSPRRRSACLTAHVPAEIPGSSSCRAGMSDEEATSRLNEMNRIGGFPWQLSFSYGRALQHAALNAWGGEDPNVQAGQAALAHRARMNGLARSGDYDPSMEPAA